MDKNELADRLNDLVLAVEDGEDPRHGGYPVRLQLDLVEFLQTHWPTLRAALLDEWVSVEERLTEEPSEEYGFPWIEVAFLSQRRDKYYRDISKFCDGEWTIEGRFSGDIKVAFWREPSAPPPPPGENDE